MQAVIVPSCLVWCQTTEDLPQTQLEMGDRSEYDRVDKLIDEVERQLIESSPDEEAEEEGASPLFNKAYRSAAVRKPRSFYNYFGEETVPLLETDPDDILLRLAGSSSASTEHEAFLPLLFQDPGTAPHAASPIPPNPP